jgi:hypothetical protein
VLCGVARLEVLGGKHPTATVWLVILAAGAVLGTGAALAVYFSPDKQPHH